MFNGVQLNELRECTVSGKQGTKQGASLSVLLANTKKGRAHTVVKCINNEVKKKKQPTKKKQNTFFKKVLTWKTKHLMRLMDNDNKTRGMLWSGHSVCSEHQKSNIQMLVLDYYMTLTWAIALWQCATFVVLERGLIQQVMSDVMSAGTHRQRENTWNAKP